MDHGGPVGVAGVLVTTDEAYILTNNIEVPRMREEQTPEMEVVEHPWPEEPAALLRELTGGSSSGTDLPPNLSLIFRPRSHPSLRPRRGRHRTLPSPRRRRGLVSEARRLSLTGHR